MLTHAVPKAPVQPSEPGAWQEEGAGEDLKASRGVEQEGSGAE